MHARGLACPTSQGPEAAAESGGPARLRRAHRSPSGRFAVLLLLLVVAGLQGLSEAPAAIGAVVEVEGAEAEAETVCLRSERESPARRVHGPSRAGSLRTPPDLSGPVSVDATGADSARLSGRRLLHRHRRLLI